MSLINIIEDEEFIANIMRVNLEEAGHKVILSSDGDIAYKNIKNNKPDLILLDIIMPNMDGFDFLKKVKSNVELKDIPIIVTSNLNQNEDIERVYSMGAVKYLIKSDITMTELVEEVNKHLK